MSADRKITKAYNAPFFVPHFPQLHPSSNEYIEFWRGQKKKVIEGAWAEVEETGFWDNVKRPVYIPGPLYFYMNMWHILLEKSAHSKAKVLGRPQVWDIFWEVAYYYTEARGFAGFDTQPEVVAYKDYLDSGVYDQEKEEELRAKIPDVRETLRNPKPEYMNGRPLFLFEASDMMWLTNRGAGKSFFIAACIAHELVTDGLKHYDPDSKERVPSVEIVVGAGDTKYSNDLLKKVKLGLDNLPGAITIGDTFFPPPLAKQLNGSFAPGKVAEHSYKKKVGGNWKIFGTGSKIKHVAWKDNPFAAQGTRPTLQIKEEVGMFDNLKASQEADVETMKAGTVKFGTCIYIGTGGDMEGGTLDAYEMYYDPETYNLLAIDDVFEDKGKICIFTPATMGKRQYKYPDGNTNFELAEKQEERFRTEKAQSKSGSSALDSYIQYNPLNPSEIFLTRSGNIFPKKELMEHLGWLETNKRASSLGVPVRLKRGDTGKVEYFIDQKLKPITTFPLKDNQEKEGCVVIYEFPPDNDTIPYGLYIGGTDPVDQDDSGTDSLMSTILYKTFQTFDGTHDIMVAEYTGRPGTAREAYETTLMLLEMYNAQTLYENQLKGFKIFAEENYKLAYLKEQPDILRDIVRSTAVSRGYGTHMTKEIKMQCELWLRDWLITKRADGEDGKAVLNLHYLNSIPLVKELIMYDREGNYDRVIALMLCIMHKQDNFKIKVVEKQRSLFGQSVKKLFPKSHRRSPFYN